MSMLVPRDKFKNIVYNDIDELLVNLFKVVKERPGELQKRLLLMPFSKAVFGECKRLVESGEVYKLDPVEKAAVFFYVISNSFNAEMDSIKVSVLYSDAKRHMRKVLALTDIAKHLLDVAIENRDFRDIIRLYDRDYTLFYCDPPYLDVVVGDRYIDRYIDRKKHYRYTFTERDMVDLLDLLSKIRGRFVLKLPEDHLQISFVREWLEKHKYSMKIVEHHSLMKKNIATPREKQRTVLIYNYEA